MASQECRHVGALAVVEREDRNGLRSYYQCMVCLALLRRRSGADWRGAEETPASIRERVEVKQ